MTGWSARSTAAACTPIWSKVPRWSRATSPPATSPSRRPRARRPSARAPGCLPCAGPPEIWESIQKGELTGYSVGGTGVRLEIEKHGNHDQSTHGNWARRGYRGDPARDGAAAEGGGTPADQGAAAARREARGAGKGGAHKVGDVVRLKEDGATGTIVDYEPGKDGAPDEYAIAPEDLGEGGPKAIWVRADEMRGWTMTRWTDTHPARWTTSSVYSHGREVGGRG